MTVTMTPLAASLEKANHEFGAFLDELSDRLSKGERLHSDGETFEQVLHNELKQASETSHLSFSASDLAPDEVLSAPPWEPLEAGAIGLLDGGLSLQNGAVYSKAGELAYTPPTRDNDPTALGVDDQAKHHWRVAFDGTTYETYTSDLRDLGGQPLAFAEGASTPWTMDAHNPMAADLVSTTAGSPDLVMATEHVFYNGDGRPIPLDSVDRLSASLAADGDQIILPDGAIFDYNPWEASIEGAHAASIDARPLASLNDVHADVIIEGQLV